MNASPACLIAFLCRIIYNKVLTKDDLQLAEGEGPSMETGDASSFLHEERWGTLALDNVIGLREEVWCSRREGSKAFIMRKSSVWKLKCLLASLLSSLRLQPIIKKILESPEETN